MDSDLFPNSLVMNEVWLELGQFWWIYCVDIFSKAVILRIVGIVPSIRVLLYVLSTTTFGKRNLRSLR
jgi:hypothetical protein